MSTKRKRYSNEFKREALKRASEGTWQSWSWPDMSSEVSLSNESAYNALRQFLPQSTSSRLHLRER